MGGDLAPKAPVLGALEAQKKYGCEITLIGQEESIRNTFVLVSVSHPVIVPHHIAQVDVCEVVLAPVLLKTSEVQDVVNKPRQALGLLRYDAEIPRLRRIVLRSPLRKHFCTEAYRRKRRLELVRDVRDERRLPLRLAPLVPRFGDQNNDARREEQENHASSGRREQLHAYSVRGNVGRTRAPQRKSAVRKHRGKCKHLVGRGFLRRRTCLEQSLSRPVPNLNDEPFPRSIGKDGRKLGEERDRLKLDAYYASVSRPAPADKGKPVAFEPRLPGEILCRIPEPFFEKRHISAEETTLLLRRPAFYRKDNAASRDPAKRVPNERLTTGNLGERGVRRI